MLARYAASCGHRVRVQSGTDDNAAKNVASAESLGVPVEELVRQNGDTFLTLLGSLGVNVDEFLRTASDPRHRVGVETLWARIEANGDLYEKEYEGLYCAGCEQFYAEEELQDGLCGEHTTKPDRVKETNWFFRLSRYQDRVADLIRSDELVIRPEQRRNEVLGFLKEEARDLSVSRPASRSNGWGIEVPGHPDQIVYVWIDALVNYITGLGYGSADSQVSDWWDQAYTSHVIGKGIIRFHAVYWVALLLSADLPLPNQILVHDYLTVDGQKISKSGNVGASPFDLIDQYGQDALRWWLVSEPGRAVSTDFTRERLLDRYNQDLANTIGNLASRVAKLAHRQDEWRRPVKSVLPHAVAEALHRARAERNASFDSFDFKAAAQAVVSLAQEGNRWIVETEPWRLAKEASAGNPASAAKFEACISGLLDLCFSIADLLAPFVPEGSARLKSTLKNEAEGVSPFTRLQ